MFGGNPRVGFRSMALPTEIFERMVTEDDLFAAFQALDPLHQLTSRWFLKVKHMESEHVILWFSRLKE